MELLEGMLAWSRERRLADGRALIARITDLGRAKGLPAPALTRPSGEPPNAEPETSSGPRERTVAATRRRDTELDPTIAMPVRDAGKP